MTSDVLMDAKGGLLTVACIQMQPSFGDVALNVKHSLQLIDKAVEKGANLVVLPELCNTGYMFASREEAFAIAEEIPRGTDGRGMDRVLRRAIDYHLVAGICERAGASLYNSAVVIGPDGFIGTFRKVHLWNEEVLYFEPGDLGFPVFHTPIGRIGVAICYDGWFPETFRLCSIAGRRHRLRAHQLGADSRTGGRPPGDGQHPRDGGCASAIRCSSPAPIASGPSEASPLRGRASSSATPAGLLPGPPAGTRRRSFLPRSISVRPGASETGMPSTRCCGTVEPTSTTRCSEAAQSLVGTDEIPHPPKSPPTGEEKS